MIPKPIEKPTWDSNHKSEQSVNGSERETKEAKPKLENTVLTHLPKRTVNQQTSPTKPYCPPSIPHNGNGKEENAHYVLCRHGNRAKLAKMPPKEKMEELSHETKLEIDILERKKSMSKISEERPETEEDIGQVVVVGEVEEKPAEDDPTVKFPNLVDSVRVAEDRLSFAQKGIRNLKTLKYIFPTSYIGTSTTSQATVNMSNITNTFCKMTKKSECAMNKSISYPVPPSAIPVPTNGHSTKSSGFLSSIIASKKFAGKTTLKAESVPVTVVTENQPKETVTETETETQIENKNENPTLTKDVAENEAREVEVEVEVAVKEMENRTETRSSSSSASVITSPSEGDNATTDTTKGKEGQTYK